MESIKLKKNPPERVIHQIPPNNGYGSEEDSLLNCKVLIPRLRDSTQTYVPPRVKNVSNVFRSFKHILRFTGKLISSNISDQERNFIISFFCRDDTIQVFEIANKNSGRESCKFMEKGKHKNPITMQDYRESDFKVGNSIFLKSFIFRLLECDQYTKNYMKVVIIIKLYIG